MKGYWTEYAYVGFMPDGSKRAFVSPEDYREAYAAALKDD